MPFPSLLTNLVSDGARTNRAAQLLSGIQSKLTRRNAIHHKVFQVCGHKFEPILLIEPTKCSQCNSFILLQQGFGCKLCKLMCHRNCLELVASHCVKSLVKSVGVAACNSGSQGHKFAETYFMTPTFCNHCGTLIKGLLSRQGLECDSKSGGCEMRIHHDCKEFVSTVCEQGRSMQHQQRQISERNLAINGGNNHHHQQQHHQQHHQRREQNWSRTNIQDFELIRLLGTGSFSKVYLARLKASVQEFAIKVVKKTNFVVSSDPESALTEMRVLSFGRQYPFLTIAHCCFQSKERLFFVMEYVVGRDLVYHIHKARKFSENRTRFHAAEIVLALRFLHKQGVVYRDLKLDNVILDRYGHCKLLDFGMSKELYKTLDAKTRTFCGTPSYIAPEIIKEADYGFSVDWWSLGVLMFEMLTGHSPFEDQDEEQLFKKIVESSPELPKYLSEEASLLLQGLLTKDPQQRLGCRIIEGCDEAIMEHAFFMFRCHDGSLAHQWDAIEMKRIRPPYRPTQEDLEISGSQEGTSLTPISDDELNKIAQTGFELFSYCSESFNSSLQTIKV